MIKSYSKYDFYVTKINKNLQILEKTNILENNGKRQAVSSFKIDLKHTLAY